MFLLICPLYNAPHARKFGYAPSLMPLMLVYLDMPPCNATHARTIGYAHSEMPLM